jgi:hypothetical protein
MAEAIKTEESTATEEFGSLIVLFDYPPDTRNA